MVGMSLVLAGIAPCHVLRAYLKFDIAVRITADDKFAVYPEYHFYKTIEISRHGRVNGATPAPGSFRSKMWRHPFGRANPEAYARYRQRRLRARVAPPKS